LNIDTALMQDAHIRTPSLQSDWTFKGP